MDMDIYAISPWRVGDSVTESTKVAHFGNFPQKKKTKKALHRHVTSPTQCNRENGNEDGVGLASIRD